VDVTRHHLFAGAALAAEHYRCIRGGNAARQVQQTPAGGILGHRLVAILDRPGAHMARHRLHQYRGLERLDQIVGRSLVHGIHRLLHRGIGGHQYHRQIGPFGMQALQQGVTVHALHVHIAQHQREILPRQPFQRSHTVRGAHHLPAFQLQDVGQRLGQGRVIFHYQNSLFHHRYLKNTGTRYEGQGTKTRSFLSHLVSRIS
jgi:hypothetical protein